LVSAILVPNSLFVKIYEFSECYDFFMQNYRKLHESQVLISCILLHRNTYEYSRVIVGVCWANRPIGDDTVDVNGASPEKIA
ncbi:MAG: hypothetical protein PVJ77_21675, partial [Desulfobacterales bacterium]